MSTEQHNENNQQPQDAGLSAPPRWLLWGVIGLFVLAIIGGAAGVWAFRDVLRPSQQQRVMDILPFMRAFMRGGEALPTPEIQATSSISAEDLLGMTIGVDTATPTATQEPTATSTVAPTVGAITPTTAPASSTPAPTATPNVTTPTPTTPEATHVGSLPNLPTANRLYGFTHIQQDWNNCGPANVTMALSYYG